MKKVLTGLILVSILVIPMVASGQPRVPAEEQAVYDTVNDVINWAFMILMLGAAVVIVVAAYAFLTAAGDPDKTSKARNYILYALVAVVVAFLAKAVIVLVGNMLGVTTELF